MPAARQPSVAAGVPSGPLQSKLLYLTRGHELGVEVIAVGAGAMTVRSACAAPRSRILVAVTVPPAVASRRTAVNLRVFGVLSESASLTLRLSPRRAAILIADLTAPHFRRVSPVRMWSHGIHACVVHARGYLPVVLVRERVQISPPISPPKRRVFVRFGDEELALRGARTGQIVELANDQRRLCTPLSAATASMTPVSTVDRALASGPLHHNARRAKRRQANSRSDKIAMSGRSKCFLESEIATLIAKWPDFGSSSILVKR